MVRSSPSPGTRCESTPAQPISEACEQVLESRPRAVKDPLLYPPQDFGRTETAQPARPEDGLAPQTHEEARTLLQAYGQAHYPDEPAKQQAFVARYDRLTRIPDINLRTVAALSDSDLLVQLIQEAKVPNRSLLLVSGVEYGQLFNPENAAEVHGLPSGRIKFVFNPDVQFESPILLAGYFRHEPHHLDRVVTDMEEAIASLADRRFLMRQTLQHTELMKDLLDRNTKLAQITRRDLAEIANAGHGTGINIFNEMGQPLLRADGQDSTRPFTRWIDIFDAEDMEPTEGNAFIEQDFPGCQEEGAWQYNRQLLECGQEQIASEFSPADIIKVMEAIGLDMTVEQPATLADGQRVRLGLDAKTARETRLFDGRPVFASVK